MKTKLSVLVLSLTMTISSAAVMAEENKGISKAELEKINIECKEDSRDAVNPEWYADECIAERVQALKEDLGLAQPEKDDS